MNKRLKLIAWVKQQHEGQVVKDLNTPYFEHLLAVANGVAAVGALTYEIGLCHDLLEKTTNTQAILQATLLDFGYEQSEAAHITNCVAELTRHFTKANNPLPKKERKALEDERLTYMSADAQTVKYADLAYNADWMMAHDRHHAREYLQRKIEIVEDMTAGDDTLRADVLKQLRELLKQL